MDERINKQTLEYLNPCGSEFRSQNTCVHVGIKKERGGREGGGIGRKRMEESDRSKGSDPQDQNRVRHGTRTQSVWALAMMSFL